MVTAAGTRLRVSVSGKFFRLGGDKFFIKGVTYGPFAPNGQGDSFATPEQTAQDFMRIRDLGANLLRVYHPPPPWFLALAQEYGLRLLVDIPWNKQVCFLDSPVHKQAARAAVRQAVAACAGHPAVLAFSLVNEIPPDIVRWSGAQAVADFIDELVAVAKTVDPECLCTFGGFPPTEYLKPRDLDFWCFNVYLHEEGALANYLARLQMIADTQPLILGEFGLDSVREGGPNQARLLSGQIDTAFRAGLAGAVIYSFTDEWFKDGCDITDWGFGLTSRRREPKPAFPVVQDIFRQAPYFPLRKVPSVSVVVSCFNGGHTLKTCLESLEHLRYPDYEVILVDDGSTDDTAAIAAGFKSVRVVQHPGNLGLSAARNTGIEAARGEVVAFTDADCRADEDWLYYLVGDLLKGDYSGVGGHNLLPPDDSWVAAAVMVSPGGPAHVMQTDHVAEHIPGCNMAFYRWALVELGGFDPVFRQAGDDVDLCWRLQERGHKICFSPAGFVWHARRSTVRAYLKQQRGYGEAEALLVRKHPEKFSGSGGSIWQGRIYSAAKYGLLFKPPRIYHGPFGSGFFQAVYSAHPELAMMFFTSLDYQALLALPLCVLAISFSFLMPVALVGVLLPAGVCVAAAAQADLSPKKRRARSRPLVALLFYLQPLVRGWARYQGRLRLRAKPLSAHENLDSLSLRGLDLRFDEVAFWTDQTVNRARFLATLLDQLESQHWEFRPDAGWNTFDVEVLGSPWSRLQMMTVCEGHGGGKYLIRCRLKASWTFLARSGFFMLLGLLVLLIGLWGGDPAWHWLLLLVMVGPAVWLWRQQRHLQRVFAVFLGDIARQLHLTLAPAPKKSENESVAES